MLVFKLKLKVQSGGKLTEKDFDALKEIGITTEPDNNELDEDVKVVASFVKDAIDKMKSELLSQKAYTSRRGLIQGIRPQPIMVNKKKIVIAITAPAYWDFINEGVKGRDNVKNGAENSPYQFKDKPPPLKAMLQYIKAKPLQIDVTPRKNKSGRELKVTKRDITKQTKRAAYALSRSIQANGIRGTHFVNNTLTPQFIEEFEQIMMERFQKRVTIKIN
jgi:hypothetical protein